jgi:hypothetical protein
MSKLAAFATAFLSTAVALAADTPTPNFAPTLETGWIAMNQDFIAVPGSPSPTVNDPKHPYIPNGRGAQPTYRVADLSNPNLKPAAIAKMKQANDEVLAGGIGYTARSSCRPAGVPGFMQFIVEPVFVVQSPKEVLMVYTGDQQVRHIYMNMPHLKSPRPTSYGDSVGRYEGDELVIDTIGMSTETTVDNFRTPHSEKLHVVEHWRLVDGGKTLEVQFTAEDPEMFVKPWSGIQRYRRIDRAPMDEQVCAENNASLFDYHIPVAAKPEF